MKKGFVWFSLAGIIVILVAVVVISIAFFPKISSSTSMSESFKHAICDNFGLFCSGEDLGYIIYFDVQQYLGSGVRIRYLYLIDEELETEVALSYSSASGEEGNIPEGTAIAGQDFYEIIYEINRANGEPDFFTKTIKITVSDKNGNEESKEVVLNPMADFDALSFQDFVKLSNTGIKSYLLGKGSEETEWRSRLHLADNLILVGFNRENVNDACLAGSQLITQQIKMPEECEGVACLCLCKAEDIIGTSGYCKERICYGFEDVDFFISESKDLHYGGRIPEDRFPWGEVYYLLLYGNCVPMIGSSWGSRDIDVEKTSMFGKTIIKIADVS